MEPVQDEQETLTTASGVLQPMRGGNRNKITSTCSSKMLRGPAEIKLKTSADSESTNHTDKNKPRYKTEIQG